MLTAQRSGYWIIQWSSDWDPSLSALVEVVPEIVLEKVVAITSCDSGQYTPLPKEIAEGWHLRGTTAVSPPVVSPSVLPTPGFDEWYVYDVAPEAYPDRNFVNRFGFSPLAQNSDDADAFWRQVAATGPLHALGAGTPNMYFITRNRDAFERLLGAGAALETG